ncbi:MAG: DUF4438 domain-containing protein [Devosia sp.]|jgi:hypothetical protein|uniref:DUF4438 domain-containing protein n=1 Tax=unclassified Devosia TaxID=196773 RepID=UPI0019FBC1B2|nr:MULTISPECIES: DUF4438 domain-containing protein [unclassified Devosia]MBF0678631.1 DUF4438 domain-containing protein [Devosia sp.]WEJ31798.1 DUF4438 domain-containing protein [Devosia sp. SD17-2]
MTISVNANDLVSVSLGGAIAHPGFAGLPAEPYRLAADGKPFLLPTWGGIVYNVSVGDTAFGWAADCIHPGVSIKGSDDLKNRGLNIYACLGNTAVVMTGRAQGAKGVVTGKSGRFSEQLIIHFPKSVRADMAVGDQILIRSLGTGMAVDGHPEVALKGLGPNLFEALPKKVVDGRLEIGVVAKVPAHLIGAGLGLTSEGGSLHMQSTDRAALKEAGLDQLRLGDLVAFENTDSRYNHGYLRGAISIGVVGQTDGPRAGYGPGVTIIMTAPKGELGCFIAPDTNLKSLLSLED